MASRHLSTFSLFSYLLFFTLLSPTCSTSTVSLFSYSLSLYSPKKVSLGLYYETLCPYSANFIINYLPKIFHDGLIDIVDLNLVPWGNAKLTCNNTFNCQHGVYECLLNTVEACAIDVWPNVNEHFRFIYCVETRLYFQWETCFKTLGLDSTPVADCCKSGYGKKLELQYAAETNALQPPHKYVPWVVVDGQPLYEDYENFISYICKAYKGTDVPKACSKLSLSSISEEKANANIDPVYHVDETRKSTPSRIIAAVKSRMRGVNAAVSI